VVLNVHQVSFSFGTKKILQNCSLNIAPGEVIALVGLSGSGKTTLLRLIAGLEKPQMGSIQRQTALSYMPQSDLLLPWRNVLDNLLLPFEIHRQEISKSFVIETLERVGLKECAHLFPRELSGGMRQRVAFVRALLLGRPLLLLDEPFNAVDLLVRENLYSLLREYLAEKKASLLFVSHDFRDALAIADRICILNEGIIQAPLEIAQDKREDPEALASYSDTIRKALSLHAL
jgi:NitT/TauT family transport system ATP-binding protein